MVTRTVHTVKQKKNHPPPQKKSHKKKGRGPRASASGLAKVSPVSRVGGALLLGVPAWAVPQTHPGSAAPGSPGARPGTPAYGRIGIDGNHSGRGARPLPALRAPRAKAVTAPHEGKPAD